MAPQTRARAAAAAKKTSADPTVAKVTSAEAPKQIQQYSRRAKSIFIGPKNLSDEDFANQRRDFHLQCAEFEWQLFRHMNTLGILPINSLRDVGQFKLIKLVPTIYKPRNPEPEPEADPELEEPSPLQPEPKSADPEPEPEPSPLQPEPEPEADPEPEPEPSPLQPEPEPEADPEPQESEEPSPQPDPDAEAPSPLHPNQNLLTQSRKHHLLPSPRQHEASKEKKTYLEGHQCHHSTAPPSYRNKERCCIKSALSAEEQEASKASKE